MVCLLNPGFTSAALKKAIPELADPNTYVKRDIPAPEGFHNQAASPWNGPAHSLQTPLQTPMHRTLSQPSSQFAPGNGGLSIDSSTDGISVQMTPGQLVDEE